MLAYLSFGIGFVVVVAGFYWYSEVYLTRKYMREAITEADAMMELELGPDWRTRPRPPSD